MAIVTCQLRPQYRPAVLGRREPVSVSEMADDPADVIEPRPGRHLLDAESRGFKKLLGPREPCQFKVSPRARPDLAPEQMAQPRDGKPRRARQLTQRQLAVHGAMHQCSDSADSGIDCGWFGKWADTAPKVGDPGGRLPVLRNRSLGIDKDQPILPVRAKPFASYREGIKAKMPLFIMAGRAYYSDRVIMSS